MKSSVGRNTSIPCLLEELVKLSVKKHFKVQEVRAKLKLKKALISSEDSDIAPVLREIQDTVAPCAAGVMKTELKRSISQIQLVNGNTVQERCGKSYSGIYIDETMIKDSVTLDFPFDENIVADFFTMNGWRKFSSLVMQRM
ncbi:hypothetical protein RRG08_039416 [Elysia crispata]|uniref:Uncharacterized protein n=1 Tax=Elysia crispata TaxID=231223 RepID=A0AAE1AAN9_9GAST|nr:hypothetical protein RRG08_039416 [Elysia crispata]